MTGITTQTNRGASALILVQKNKQSFMEQGLASIINEKLRNNAEAKQQGTKNRSAFKIFPDEGPAFEVALPSRLGLPEPEEAFINAPLFLFAEAVVHEFSSGLESSRFSKTFNHAHLIRKPLSSFHFGTGLDNGGLDLHG